MYDFLVNYNSIHKSDILNIHKYLMVKNNKKMFELIKQEFLALLSFSRSLPTKCVSLYNEPCVIQPFLIDLNPVELKV